MEPHTEIQQAKPDIKFIYATHSLENFDKIWNEAKKADVILLEATGKTDESRKQSEELVNWAAKIDNLETKKSALYLLGNEDGSIDFHYKIIEKVVNEGKSLYYIDEADGGGGLALSIEAKEAISAATELLCAGKPLDAYNSYKEYVIKLTKSISHRNDTVKQQIKEIANANQDTWVGKKIVVIQGTGHRETYHTLKKDIKGSTLSRTFIEPQRTFDLLLEAESRIIHGIDNNIENVIKRGFLAFYIVPLYDEKTRIGVDISLKDNVARSLSDEEVERYFQRITELQTYLDSQNDRQFAIGYGFKQLDTLGIEILEKYEQKTGKSIVQV